MYISNVSIRYIIYVFISSAVHFSRTLLVLLHRHFSSDLALSLIVSIITNCTYTHMSKSNIMAYVNNSFTFFKSAYDI